MRNSKLLYIVVLYIFIGTLSEWKYADGHVHNCLFQENRECIHFSQIDMKEMAKLSERGTHLEHFYKAFT